MDVIRQDPDVPVPLSLSHQSSPAHLSFIQLDDIGFSEKDRLEKAMKVLGTTAFEMKNHKALELLGCYEDEYRTKQAIVDASKNTSTKDCHRQLSKSSIPSFREMIKSLTSTK